MDGLTINKENLKFHKFEHLGVKRWQKTFEDTFVRIEIDISDETPHIVLWCLNDSIHVTNCQTMKDLFDLDRLFGTYFTP